MKGLLVRLALLLGVLAVVGFVVAASGIVPIRASSGHSPPVRWFLSFSMARSVSTWSLGTRVPDLEDPALVLRGAGHYASGCAPCHGAPGRRRSEVAVEMTPHPPLLGEVASGWDREELFYIVKHGVKMTGMPAWPARERDDEVWAMVAFLGALPSLDPESYRELAYGPVEPPELAASTAGGAALEEIGGAGATDEPGSAVPAVVRRSCARCHGPDGSGRGAGAFPRLDGQKAPYLEGSLRAYASGLRHSGIMESATGELEEADFPELARYFAGGGRTLGAAEGDTAGPAGPAASDERDGAAGAPVTAPGTATAGSGGSEAGGGDQADAALPSNATGGDPERGRALAERGDAARKIPACVHCHGPAPGLPDNDRYPRLAGQHAGYLLLQLRLFHEERRGGSPWAHLMTVAAEGLDERDMRDLVAWYASLPWDGAESGG